MLVRASLDTHEIEMVGTSDEWETFADFLESEKCEYPLSPSINVAPWDICLTAIHVERVAHGLVFVHCSTSGILTIQGSPESLHVLSENARDMIDAEVEGHVHVDAAILPEVISEVSATMVWLRSCQQYDSSGNDRAGPQR